MSLKYRYYTFIIILHVILTGLLYYILKEKKLYFILCEVGILLSIYLSYLLYRLFAKPLEIIEAGKNSILDEDFTIKYNYSGAKETDSLIRVYNNMIDRLRNEKTRTEEQSYFLENLIDNSPLGMIIMDYDQKIVTINSKARQFLKVGNGIGKLLRELDSELATEISQISMFEEKVIAIDGLKKFKCKNHELIHKGFARQFILIEELTSDILQAEKQAYGKVIRMMAHEVNNSMGAVNSILGSVLEFGFNESAESQEFKKYLGAAIDRNKMLGKFTNNFAEVIRLPDPLRSKLDLNSLVLKTMDYYRLIAKDKGINFDLRTYPEPIVILADKVQLEQAFSNIVKNAIESIEMNGTIIFTTTPNPATLTISDTGKGIHADVSDKIFTPFFSTKTSGQGIGLMLIRDILNNHEAEFRLFSEEHTKYTHFEIIFEA